MFIRFITLNSASSPKLQNQLNRSLSYLVKRRLQTATVSPLKDAEIKVSLDEEDKQYRIKLNDVSIKTPKQNYLKVRDKSLALAIANEWKANIGKKKLNLVNMHLTTLAYTAIDNPFEETNDSLIKATIEYLRFDTTRFRDVENQELLQRQSRHWDPLVGWFEHKFNCHLPIDYGDITSTSNLPDNTTMAIERYLTSQSRWPLVGFSYLTRNLKSFVLATTLSERLLTAEKAVELARLESRFQIEKWSKVEWEHDMDEQCTNARVAAGTLFYHLSI